MIAREHALARRILGLVPINSLDPRLQDQALAQGELLEFKRKKTVFEAGARDPYTFYLLDGELELQAQGASPVRMQAGDENARRALAQLQPRRYTAVAMTPVTLFRIERAVLDHILADEQMLEDAAAGSMDVREIEEEEDEGGDWMTRLLSSELFIRLPNENIQRFFTELEPLEAAEGTLVVEQGTQGDYLYIVAEGRCAVERRAPGGGQEVQLAVLKEGDTFGEEAIISNSPRNASVRMLNDGMLMRLPKQAFHELIGKPTLKAVPWSEASAMVESGAQWLDVRFPDEHESQAIEGSRNVPLNALRLQASKLDRDSQYIMYCDTGARSSAGAFLLARLGFEVCYLAGGLERSPLGQGAAATVPAGEASAAAPAAEAAPVAAPASAGGGVEFEFVTSGAGPQGAQKTDAPEPAPAGAKEAPAPGQAAKPAPTPAAKPQPAPAPATPAAAPAPAAVADMGALRARLAALEAERDKAAAYGKKAADTARELKRRYEELAGSLKAERSRRETLDKELAAAKADAQRAESLEQSRLKGELDKAAKRLESLQQERDGEKKKADAERERLDARAKETEAKIAGLAKESQDKLAALAKQLEEAESARMAAEAAFQDQVQSARAEAADHRSRQEKAERELAEVRSQLAAAEARNLEATQDLNAHALRAEQAVAEAREQMRAEAEALEQQRARLAEELESAQRARHEAETKLRSERAALEKGQAALAARVEALDAREQDLAQARQTVDEELSAREAGLAEHETALADREAALSREKVGWKTTVERAISEERARLDGEYARFREEAEAEVEKRVAALVEERLADVREEHETREAEMRDQVEAHVAKLLTEFDQRLAKVRSGYETRLAEQEAVLEDERQRLETEVVRLREALESARKAPTAAPAPELDLQIQEPEPAPGRPRPAAPVAKPTRAREEPRRAPARPQPAAPVPELDLEIDESELPATAKSAAPEKPAPQVDAMPVIEIPGEDEPRPAKAPEDSKRRIISPNQLADIRKRMEEKMRAARSKAG